MILCSSRLAAHCVCGEPGLQVYLAGQLRAARDLQVRFILNMMDLSLKMMDFVLKIDGFHAKNDGTFSLLAGCICQGGFLGPRCDDASCIGVQCGPHGTCVSAGGAMPGRCVCDEGYGGANCDTVTGPCGGECKHNRLQSPAVM